MPTDWKSLAIARGLDLDPSELVLLSSALRSLEETFRPLVLQLPHEIEPALILSESALQGQ